MNWLGANRPKTVLEAIRRAEKAAQVAKDQRLEEQASERARRQADLAHRRAQYRRKR